MNRKARALPDVMITFAAPDLAFLLYFILFYFLPYNKQLNNLDRSVFTGKSQTSAYHIDLAIARSIRQDLSLRFSRNDLTLGY